MIERRISQNLDVNLNNLTQKLQEKPIQVLHICNHGNGRSVSAAEVLSELLGTERVAYLAGGLSFLRNTLRDRKSVLDKTHLSEKEKQALNQISQYPYIAIHLSGSEQRDFKKYLDYLQKNMGERRVKIYPSASEMQAVSDFVHLATQA